MHAVSVRSTTYQHLYMYSIRAEWVRVQRSEFAAPFLMHDALARELLRLPAADGNPLQTTTLSGVRP
jgi:hypothetical protein